MSQNRLYRFNTSGPNIIAQHYTLLRDDLVQQGIIDKHIRKNQNTIFGCLKKVCIIS
jgi:hypothetical protein